MNVLIVEDDENKRQHLVRLLKKELGAHITERKSYQSGLKEITHNAYDVMLLDMTMHTYDKSPVENGGLLKHFAGREILAQMDRKHRVTPVIVVTQYDNFGEGAAKKSLSELKKELEEGYRRLYMGTVYYDVASDSWHKELINLIHKTLARRGDANA